MRDRPRTALIVLGVIMGLWGLRWGLPDRARIDRILVPGMDGPALHERMSNSWIKMHERLGPNLMNAPESFATFSGIERVKPGWSEPPEILLNSIRSFYVRSSYEDEQSALLALSRMRPLQLNFNPHLFTYGGAYLYPLGAWEAAGAVVGAVKLHSSLMPYLADPAKMGGMYYWGRLLSALAFIGCALLLLRIGRTAHGSAMGLIAGLLFLLSPVAIINGHALKNHIVWSFFALLTLDRCQAVLARGGARDYAWAGAAAGLTVGAFLMGWPATLFVAVAALIRLRRTTGSAANELRGVGIAAACAVAAFFISNPYWALSLGEALQEMKTLGTHSYFDWRSPAIFLGMSMRKSITAPVLLLVLAGVVHAARRSRREPGLALILGAFLAGLSFAWVSSDVVSAFGSRYALGWIAIGLLLAARAAVDAWAATRAGLRPGLAVVFAAGLLHLAVTGATYAQNFRLDEGAGSSHVVSGAWIEENIPAGASIGMLRLPQPSNAPYFKYHRYDLHFIEPRLFGGLPPAQLPRYMAVTLPIHDDRPKMEPNLSRYERIAIFGRRRIVPWIAVDPASSNANPLIEIYRLKS